MTLQLNREAYSGPSKISKMEHFCENCKLWKAFKYFCQKLHLRCLSGF